MGLTHSWLRPTELPVEPFAAAIRNIQQVLGTIKIPLSGFEGHGQPIFLDEGIVFNGVAGSACEPFEIHRVEFDRHGRSEKLSFCKTQGLPYDLAVKIALIIFKHHLGDVFTVMSDEFDSGWSKACELVSQIAGFGCDFKLDRKS